MTYNHFFDFYFSHIGLSIGFPFLLIFLAVLLLKLNNEKNRIRKWLLILLFPIALLLLITAGSLNQSFFGYGKPVEISSLHTTSKGLIVLDYILTMGGKSSKGVPHYRIHRIDPVSGKKTIRFLTNEKGEFAGTRGDTLAFARYDNVSLYSIGTGKEIKHLDKETLPVVFSELTDGIHQINWRWGSLFVTATNGTQWVIDPLTNTILPDHTQEYTSYKPSFKLSINNNVVLYDNKPGGTDIIALKSQNINPYQKYLMKDDFIFNKNLSFLEGELVGLSSQDSCYIIRSYTSMEKTEFLYSAISFDGKTKLWEINSSTLSADQSSHGLSTTTTTDETNRVVFLSCEEEIFSIRLKDGKILWRTSL